MITSLKRIPPFRSLHLATLLFGFLIAGQGLQAQVQASGFGFNYFDRVWVSDNNDGAGYSFYAGVWPIMQQYPGPENFQLGLPSTWMTPLETGTEPGNFYNTIEGGLGWWGDTRFATETPKFIMGGVAFDFNQWANGVGAGSSDLLPSGHRDWSEPGGKYGVAQLSPNLLWPPDGLNMEQGANGEFLGYGYHPLPITDPLEETNGVDFATGNQCWTLFLNTTNFKGPATFFIPTFWTETVLDDPNLEGLFLDTRPSDKNLAFAIEYAESPALIAEDELGNTFARVLPLVYPATTDNRSEVIREIKVYSKDAKWTEVENWFNGGTAPSTVFVEEGAQNIVFDVWPEVDGHIATDNGGVVEAMINHDLFAEKINTPNQRVAGFEWNTDIVSEENGNFVMPEFYRLTPANLWEPITPAEVPASTDLAATLPEITPRPDHISYLTPMEPDCHWQDPLGPWNSPGPSAGPFTAQLGDGSILTYYWYRFIDQPAIIHADLPEAMRQSMQERIELIHTSWTYTDEYLADPIGGSMVGLDPGLIVQPPAGMEIGYVPVVTRQEKDPNPISSTFESANPPMVSVFPNPTNGLFRVESSNNLIVDLQLYNAQGVLLDQYVGINQKGLDLDLSKQAAGLFYLVITDARGGLSNQRVVKSK
ncbi:MAG: T9SS type A sorting domain-containing protein [Bacteroidota bacterium]